MTLALFLVWMPSPLQTLLKVWRSLVDLLVHFDRYLGDPLLLPGIRDSLAGRRAFERGLRVAEGMVAILVALRTRELLGLSLKLPRSLSQPRAARQAVELGGPAPAPSAPARLTHDDRASRSPPRQSHPPSRGEHALSPPC
jgi:hypothetical protein